VRLARQEGGSAAHKLLVCDKDLNHFKDPLDWTKANAISWMNWIMEQYNLVSEKPLLEWVGDGPHMSEMDEDDFKDKISVVSRKIEVLSSTMRVCLILISFSLAYIQV